MSYATYVYIWTVVTRLEPIMLLKLPIMLLSSAQNHAHDQQIKHLIGSNNLVKICAHYNMYKIFYHYV